MKNVVKTILTVFSAWMQIICLVAQLSIAVWKLNLQIFRRNKVGDDILETEITILMSVQPPPTSLCQFGDFASFGFEYPWSHRYSIRLVVI